MAGAVIADLALEGRIDTDLEALYLLDATPTGDELLDPTLLDISGSKETSSTQYWIERNTARSEEIVAETLDRLVNKGVLDYESGGFWTLSRAVSHSSTYPSADGTTRMEAKARILRTILDDEIPDPRDAILIALMHTCGGFKLILPEEDYEENLGRIETLSKLDLVGRTVSTAVWESAFKPKTRRILPAKPIPKLKLTDILRQRDFLSGNIPKATCQIFEKYGSVVEFPFRMGGQRVIALIGPEANHWVNRQGRFFLRSKDYIVDLEGAFGAARTLPGMHRSDPQFLPETDIVFPFVASMVASIYLGSSLGFAVYAMVRDPELYEAVRREADALFGNGGDPQASDFNPGSMDVTHRLFLESERMYPVIPWQLKNSDEPVRRRWVRNTGADPAARLQHSAALLGGPLQGSVEIRRRPLPAGP